MDIYDFFDDLKNVETLTTKDFVIKNTAMRIIGFYRVTDLGYFIASLNILTDAIAEDLANDYDFKLVVNTYENRIMAVTEAFKMLKNIVNTPKYQSYYKQWLTTH